MYVCIFLGNFSFQNGKATAITGLFSTTEREVVAAGDDWVLVEGSWDSRGELGQSLFALVQFLMDVCIINLVTVEPSY